VVFFACNFWFFAYILHNIRAAAGGLGIRGLNLQKVIKDDNLVILYDNF
jgi:hypothetical protein